MDFGFDFAFGVGGEVLVFAVQVHVTEGLGVAHLCDHGKGELGGDAEILWSLVKLEL